MGSALQIVPVDRSICSDKQTPCIYINIILCRIHTHTHTLHVFGNLINKSSTCSNSTYEYMGNPASLKTMETCSQSFLHQTNDCFLFGPLAPHGGSTTDVPLKLFYIYFCMHVYKYKCTYIYTYIKSWIYKYVIINIHVPVKICGHLGE